MQGAFRHMISQRERWLLGFRSVVKNPCFISSHSGVQKIISFLCSTWETSAQNLSVSFCDCPLTFWAPSMHTIFRTLIFVTASRIVVLDTLGMMWCNSLIAYAPHIWRDFGTELPFQTRHTQTKPVLPPSNEQGSQVKDQGQRQCCHNKRKKFPYRPTCDVSLLSWHALYISLEIQGSVLQHLANSRLLRWRSLIACRCQVRLQDLDCRQNQQAYILQIKLTQIIADAGNALCCCQVNKWGLAPISNFFSVSPQKIQTAIMKSGPTHIQSPYCFNSCNGAWPVY